MSPWGEEPACKSHCAACRSYRLAKQLTVGQTSTLCSRHSTPCQNCNQLPVVLVRAQQPQRPAQTGRCCFAATCTDRPTAVVERGQDQHWPERSSFKIYSMDEPKYMLLSEPESGSSALRQVAVARPDRLSHGKPRQQNVRIQDCKVLPTGE